MSPSNGVAHRAAGTSVLERSRMRTWESETEAQARPAWRIIAKYGMVRLLRTWWLSTILVILLLATVIALGMQTYGVSGGRAMSQDGATANPVFFIVQAMLMALLVGGPLFADDIRFNAPLFYFSRPVERTEYVYGKAATLVILFVVLAILPLLLLIPLFMASAFVAEVPEYTQSYYDAADRARLQEDWRTTHIDTFGDALYVAFTVLPGMVVVLAFLGSATMLASAYTRRGWHGAMALVTVIGIWGMLGMMAQEFTRDATAHLFGPFGWFYLIVNLPGELRFYKPIEERNHAAFGYGDLEQYENAGFAIALAYMIVIGLSIAFAWLARRRVIAQGESL